MDPKLSLRPSNPESTPQKDAISIVIEDSDENTTKSKDPGLDSPKWPTPVKAPFENSARATSSLFKNDPSKPEPAKGHSLDDNFFEGVEKLQAELQQYIKTKDEQMIQISKQKTPFKATLNQLQRGKWDSSPVLTSSRRLNTNSRSPVV